MYTPGSVPRHVFTPEWIAHKVRKYGKCADHARPSLYRLWVSDECQSRRDEIERLVEALPPAARQQVIPRLRTPEQFAQTWNELAVGDSFRRMGHRAEYEKDLEGVTPDWFVTTAVASRFIAEVVSSMAPVARQRCDAAWDLFMRRVSTLPGDFSLSIAPPFDYESFAYFDPPAVPRQKQIARTIGRWLAAGPSDRAVKTIDEIEITLIGRIPGLNHVTCGIGLSPFIVDGEPLWETVKEKASKYKDVAVALQLPFVVCVVPDFSSGRDIRDLQDAVLGAEKCHLLSGPGGIRQAVYHRASDGLFAKYPALSAVTLAQWDRGSMQHELILNPHAAHPLDISTFQQKVRPSCEINPTRLS
jgi:hypothetical protein